MLVQPLTEWCQGLTTACSQCIICVATLYVYHLILVCFLSQVSNGSDVYFEDENLSLSCEVRKAILPHGNEHLMSWAKHHYRAATSFTELKMTHDVHIKVGEGVYVRVGLVAVQGLICLVIKVFIFLAHDVSH